MLNKLREYFETECSKMETLLKRSDWAQANVEKVVKATIHEFCGAATFVMLADSSLNYTKVNPIFETYRRQLEFLLDKYS